MNRFSERLVHDVFDNRSKYLRKKIKQLRAEGKESLASIYDIMLHEGLLLKGCVVISPEWASNLDEELAKVWKDAEARKKS